VSLLIIVVAYRYWHMIAEYHRWKPFSSSLFLLLRILTVVVGLIGLCTLVLFAPMQFALLDERPVTISSDQGFQLPVYVSETHPALLHDLHHVGVDGDLSSLFLSKSASGFYMPATRSITLKSVYRPIYWHELGHHIHSWLLTDEERAAYASLHEYDLDRFHLFDTWMPRTFPSEYAMSGVEEDFADTFIIYAAGTDDPFGRSIDPRRKEIIDTAVRRITQCNLPDPQQCLFTTSNVHIFR
jgi:hypothetical protein